MSKTVLLVEDEPNIIEAISFLLERDGWTVRIHSQGDDAVDAVLRVAPDVLVLDVMLPGRSGFDILRDLRSNTVTKDLPILMLTARGQTKDRELAESYGVSHFMTKPFSNDEMLGKVRDLYTASADKP
ncbi:Response regulator receiver domain-containing protein [Litoreibacter ascidiaceicola]|uniref:Response regulator receiver domain-containing protein n=1 Tax=Litoreibacter ascidiaceicola TaxID=1486859 RepID=A0A1M4SWP9_9RHOB|nr:response regulator [Litoreibacter ascidiaceicola]SHE36621.1 Response regulator receiver domain-containing protein [Litoreibacter ascidiaceicola]